MQHGPAAAQGRPQSLLQQRHRCLSKKKRLLVRAAACSKDVAGSVKGSRHMSSCVATVLVPKDTA